MKTNLLLLFSSFLWPELVRCRHRLMLSLLTGIYSAGCASPKDSLTKRINMVQSMRLRIVEAIGLGTGIAALLMFAQNVSAQQKPMLLWFDKPAWQPSMNFAIDINPQVNLSSPD